ncbi:hypothetical protein PENSTE_c017G00209 [Penicillium steckii]|uniref:Sulfotransferase domain-containing protein n=1 Tax=Penicillium steckii TaxID=303698 RepID=A0A1V6SXC2_9EURO|nr:hypothetical protein PENSTE_c017G00209 [Penicillium steckii]
MTRTNDPPLLIITYPRSASNLLMRILSLPNQPNVVAEESGGYFFFPALNHIRKAKLLDRLPEQWSDQELAAVQQEFQSCYHNFQGLIDAAEAEGKRAVIKEHAPFLICPQVQANFVHERRQPHTPMKVDIGEPHCSPGSTGTPGNETVLPDEVLLRCLPAFLIRHPALAFPSYYRVMLGFDGGDKQQVAMKMNDVAATCTLRWTRTLYDWYTAAWEGQRSPIILDADDIVEQPELTRHFCDLVGLDSSKVQFEWKAVDQDQLAQNPVRLHTRSTLMTSSGIKPGKTFRGLSIDEEVVKWKAEFGDSVANTLQKWVQGAMADYEYLSNRRLTL